MYNFYLKCCHCLMSMLQKNSLLAIENSKPIPVNDAASVKQPCSNGISNGKIMRVLVIVSVACHFPLESW